MNSQARAHTALRRNTILFLGAVLFCVTAMTWLPTFTKAATDVTWLHAIHDDAAVTTPTTVRSRIVLGPQVRTTDQGVWLAGFAAEPGGQPSVLSVTFSQVGSGWLGPMWGVQLQSDAGLIPRALVQQAGTGFLAGSNYVPLHTSALPWGHEIEITFGYDPKTGAASVALFDVTDDRWVLTRNLQLEPYDGALVPAAGIATTADAELSEPIVTFTSFATEDRVLPARFSWWIMEREGEDRPYSSTLQLDRTKQAAVSMHLPWTSLSGDVQLRLVNEQGETVRTVRDISGVEYVPFETTDLPGGMYEAIIEYATEDEAWELDRRDLTVGVIGATIESIYVAEVGEDEAVVEGVLRIVGDGPLDNVAVGLSGEFIRHTFVTAPDGRSGKTHKEPMGSVKVLSAHGLDSDVSGTVAFSETVPMPLIEDGVGWELKVQPFGLPDRYFVETATKSVWLVQPETPLPWLGFLANEDAEWIEWVPGIDVVSMNGYLPAGPLKMHLVVADVTRDEITVDALIGKGFETEASRWARAQVSHMVRDSGALFGINSAFFDIRNTQIPSGMVIQSGQLLKSGSTNAVAFDATGRPYIGQWQWHGRVSLADGSQGRTITGLNLNTSGSELMLYRWPMTHTPGAGTPEAVEIVLSDVVEEDDTTEGSQYRQLRGVVSEIRQGEGSQPIAPGTAVLAGGGLNTQYLLDTYPLGETVLVEYRLLSMAENAPVEDWRDLWGAASGGVMLLRNGEDGEGSVRGNTDRHPRTALAVNEDQSIMYWLVVEGRSVDSVGMTYGDMADYFKYLGATYAINLDGGGSSTLVGRNLETGSIDVINVTSDGGERYVPDGIGIFYEAP